jgi:hypothetical protein
MEATALVSIAKGLAPIMAVSVDGLISAIRFRNGWEIVQTN